MDESNKEEMFIYEPYLTLNQKGEITLCFT